MNATVHTITVTTANGRGRWDAERYDYMQEASGVLRIMDQQERAEVARFAPGQWVCVTDSRHMLGTSS